MNEWLTLKQNCPDFSECCGELTLNTTNTTHDDFRICQRHSDYLEGFLAGYRSNPSHPSLPSRLSDLSHPSHLHHQSGTGNN